MKLIFQIFLLIISIHNNIAFRNKILDQQWFHQMLQRLESKIKLSYQKRLN